MDLPIITKEPQLIQTAAEGIQDRQEANTTAVLRQAMLAVVFDLGARTSDGAQNHARDSATQGPPESDTKTDNGLENTQTEIKHQ